MNTTAEIMASPALAAACEYHRRGWRPTPVAPRGKRPTLMGWPTREVVADDLPRLFPPGVNVGVVLGDASSGLVDIDLDCQRAIELADDVLPPTGAIFGRASARRSHWLYYVTGPSQIRRFAGVAEFRGTGGQTVFPGSVHPSGEPVEWDRDGEPATVDADELLQAVAEPVERATGDGNGARNRAA